PELLEFGPTDAEPGDPDFAVAQVKEIPAGPRGLTGAGRGQRGGRGERGASAERLRGGPAEAGVTRTAAPRPPEHEAAAPG
ncbi:hypothetical protein VR46_44510, partial [Streptomyces sp. NRRL S-444]